MDLNVRQGLRIRFCILGLAFFLFTHLFTVKALAFDVEPSVGSSAESRTTDLYKNALEFFTQIQKTSASAHVFNSLYGDVWQLGYVDLHTFVTNVIHSLQRYRPLFERVAEETELDWRLLAAMAYQESFWNPRAVSPTGVRGLMMLTKATASELGIKDRRDPMESVRGGARYYKILKRKLPARIPEPDRTWMALAAYNVGFGHLEDARILTQRLGSDPDKWDDVKKHLLLLNKPKWYRQTKRGHARGHESVKFVRNIRNYLSVLIRLSTDSVDEDMVAETEPRDNDPHSM